MPMKSVLFSTSVTNFSRSASARLRSVMSTPVGARNSTRPVSSLIGWIVTSAIRSLPSATKYGISARRSRPAAAWRRALICFTSRDGCPPGTFPERLADDLLPGVAAGLPRQAVRLEDGAVTSMIAGEQRALLEERVELGVGRAASASSWRSRCSACRWRVTSRTILDAPITRPSSSLIGEIVSDTRMRRPSARSRSVSK